MLLMYHSSSSQSPGAPSDGLSCFLSAQQVSPRTYPCNCFFSQTIEGSAAASSTPPFSPPPSLPRFIAGFCPRTLVTRVILIWMQAHNQSAQHFGHTHLLSGKNIGKPSRELWPAGEDPLLQHCLPGVPPGKSSSSVRSLWVQRQAHWKWQICI